jgi:hypothetical protein
MFSSRLSIPQKSNCGNSGKAWYFGPGFFRDDANARPVVFLKAEPVRDEELEGYKYYLDEMRKKIRLTSARCKR